MNRVDLIDVADDIVLSGSVDSAFARYGYPDDPTFGDLCERGDLPWTKGCAYSFEIAFPSGQTFEVIIHEKEQAHGGTD